MNENMRELLKRIEGDSAFRERVVDRTERDRAKKRPANRAHSDKYRHLHPVRESARKAVTWALKRREIFKPSACIFNRTDCLGRLEAHHHLGYAPEHWLHVVWICHHHHELVEHGGLPLPHR